MQRTVSPPIEEAQHPSALPPHASGDPNGTAGRLLSSFRERDFLLLWLSMLGGMTAMGMQQVAMGYLAYDLTGSATALGAVAMAWGGPQLVFALVGGVVADRFPKRNVLVASQSIMAIAALTSATLVATGMIQIWHLVVVGLIQGTVFAFNMPARQSLIPAIVGRDNLANAIALNNAGMNLTRIVGPTLAGFLIAIPAVGISGVFYVMAGCYIYAISLLSRIPEGRGGSGGALRGSATEQLTAGFRYIFQQPKLVSLLAAAFAVVLLAMPYQTLLPLFALQVHDVGSTGLGLLNGAAGLGALMGSFIVAYISASPRKEDFQTGAGIGFGLALVAFALAPSFPIALAAIFFAGAAGNMYMALNNTLLMMNTDSAMYGRVMSVYMMTFALMPLASFPMSVVADMAGAPLTVACAGGLSAVAVIGVTLVNRRRQTQALPLGG